MPSRYIATIICFANSKKLNGRCVAGKLIQHDQLGSWIRPVSSRPGGEISQSEMQLRTGGEPVLLDVISVPMLRGAPHGYQSENHTIDASAWWTRVRRASFAEARAALDAPQPDLWGTSSSSYSGINDRIAIADASVFDHSLRLIEVSDLRIRVSVEGAAFNNQDRRIRGYFSYSKNQYAISITDPAIEAKYFAMKDGWHDVGKAILCVSLGEPYKGHAYKLIAGVILPA